MFLILPLQTYCIWGWQHPWSLDWTSLMKARCFCCCFEHQHIRCLKCGVGLCNNHLLCYRKCSSKRNKKHKCQTANYLAAWRDFIVRHSNHRTEACAYTGLSLQASDGFRFSARAIYLNFKCGICYYEEFSIWNVLKLKCWHYMMDSGYQ